jgi:hypothetical protein
MPLRGSRRLAAWATIALFAVTFSPVPLSQQLPNAPPPGQGDGQTYSVSFSSPASAPQLPMNIRSVPRGIKIVFAGHGR